jgi:hypothetical protein
MWLYNRQDLVNINFVLQADKNPQIDEAVWKAWVENKIPRLSAGSPQFSSGDLPTLAD